MRYSRLGSGNFTCCISAGFLLEEDRECQGRVLHQGWPLPVLPLPFPCFQGQECEPGPQTGDYLCFTPRKIVSIGGNFSVESVSVCWGDVGKKETNRWERFLVLGKCSELERGWSRVPVPELSPFPCSLQTLGSRL